MNCVWGYQVVGYYDLIGVRISERASHTIDGFVSRSDSIGGGVGKEGAHTHKGITGLWNFKSRPGLHTLSSGDAVHVQQFCLVHIEAAGNAI